MTLAFPCLFVVTTSPTLMAGLLLLAAAALLSSVASAVEATVSFCDIGLFHNPFVLCRCYASSSGMERAACDLKRRLSAAACLSHGDPYKRGSMPPGHSYYCNITTKQVPVVAEQSVPSVL